MPMEVVALEHGGRVTYAFARRAVPMTEIAIVGAGIHPFGRHEGVSGLAMGVHAVRAALADAGIAWPEVQFAYGGSEDAGNADTMVADLGPTGLPFVNVKNGCATGGSSLVSAVRALESGAYDVGARRRLRQAPARRVPERPRRLVAAGLVRRGRPDGDDAVLRREAAALHARPRHPGARRSRRSRRRRSATGR